MNIGEILKDKEVCICAGSGGVGKTTAAAAIAMGMAAEGKKVAVVTIDPAKRLASALGLKRLGNKERLIEPERFVKSGIEMKGELWAMMLDPKRTWDELIEHHAPDEKTRDNVLNNRIYKELSSALVGSQEYMAMEKLFELHSEGRYDLIVLDTPPTRNALDFLEAPERLTNFIEGSSLKFFLKGGRFGMRVFGRGTSMLFSILKRLTGMDLLKDLSEFFQSFGSMAGGFQERAAAVTRLISDKRTVFTLVTAPEPEAIEEAIFFLERMRESKLPFGAAIINKVHPDYLRQAEKNFGKPTDQILEDARENLSRSMNGTEGGARLADTIYENLHDYQMLAARDNKNIKRLMKKLKPSQVVQVPYFDDDIHDIDGLCQINKFLFSSAKERNAIIDSVSH